MNNFCSSAFDDWVHEVLVVGRDGLFMWHFFTSMSPKRSVKEDFFFLDHAQNPPHFPSSECFTIKKFMRGYKHWTCHRIQSFWGSPTGDMTFTGSPRVVFFGRYQFTVRKEYFGFSEAYVTWGTLEQKINWVVVDSKHTRGPIWHRIALSDIQPYW